MFIGPANKRTAQLILVPLHPFPSKLLQSSKGLIDTGADVTIIRGQDWPSIWPLAHILQEIGYSTSPKQSSNLRFVKG